MPEKDLLSHKGLKTTLRGKNCHIGILEDQEAKIKIDIRLKKTKDFFPLNDSYIFSHKFSRELKSML